MDARDFHAATCNVGGGVEYGHNRIRDWLCEWLGERLGQQVSKESHVSGWDKPMLDDNGQQMLDEEGHPKFHHAVLDAAFYDGQGRRAYVDVVVTSAATTSAADRAKGASTDGAAAADAVRGKKVKYPAAKLPNNPMTPFALEALGRMSPEAEDFLRAHAPEDKAERSLVLRRAKQSLSVLVQERLAELLLSAEASGQVGRRAAAAL